jgi:hypothetical protein
MEMKVEQRKKSNLLLILAVIAASLLVVWVITLFDKHDDPKLNERINNRVIKQTITKSDYNFFHLLKIEKKYT